MWVVRSASLRWFGQPAGLLAVLCLLGCMRGVVLWHLHRPCAGPVLPARPPPACILCQLHRLKPGAAWPSQWARGPNQPGAPAWSPLPPAKPAPCRPRGPSLSCAGGLALQRGPALGGGQQGGGVFQAGRQRGGGVRVTQGHRLRRRRQLVRDALPPAPGAALLPSFACLVFVRELPAAVLYVCVMGRSPLHCACPPVIDIRRGALPCGMAGRWLPTCDRCLGRAGGSADNVCAHMTQQMGSRPQERRVQAGLLPPTKWSPCWPGAVFSCT